jgi:hypothetical protein
MATRIVMGKRPRSKHGRDLCRWEVFDEVKHKKQASRAHEGIKWNGTKKIMKRGRQTA